jgi:hypothetical protein
MTSSREQEEPGAGEEQVKSGNSEKVDNNGQQVNSHGQSASSRQREVLHHFIHTPIDAQRSQDSIIDSTAMASRQRPSESKRMGELPHNSGVAEQGSLDTTEEVSTSADASEALREDSSTDGSDQSAGAVGGGKKKREKKKKAATKKDRANLRKGKWTVS